MQNSSEEPVADSGREFVFDSRKLIVAFGLLIAICGCFFVIGFVEGKRQGMQAGVEQAAINAPVGREEKPPQPSAKAGTDSARNTPGDRPVREQLEWYKSVGKGEDTGIEHTPAGAHEGRAGNEKSSKAKEGVQSTTQPAVGKAAAGYSVQVGAFRLLKEAQSKAEMLKAKGYAFTIDPPSGPNQLYLLKVGKFESRADAAAMQLRLKKDGFPTFIKAN